MGRQDMIDRIQAGAEAVKALGATSLYLWLASGAVAGRAS